MNSPAISSDFGAEIVCGLHPPARRLHSRAYGKGVMRHTRDHDLRTERGYVQSASLVTASPVGMIDL